MPTESNFAFLKTGADAFLWGSGEFASSATPPERGGAFYVNDFELSDPEPWKVPEEMRRVGREEALEAAADGLNPDSSGPRVRWEALAENGFGAIFGDIMEDIVDGRIKKSVPVLTEKGTVETGELRALARVVQQLPEPFMSYGLVQGAEGFIGATPEQLFNLSGTRLETMALAGTAPASERDDFLRDAKEIHEHELVAGWLMQRLADLGEVERGERECMDLGVIVHFLTRITVELSRPRTIDGLIHRMHPTPALGSFPRTMHSLRKLNEYRSALRAPAHFGAPFGAIHDGEFTSVVAIRNVSWRKGEVSLASGCGVIEESTLPKEWKELALKRRSVKEFMGL